MKHKEKQQEYTRQYQTMCAKEWRKVAFSVEKKFNFGSPDGFQKYWHRKKFQEENYTTRHRERGSLISSSGKLQLQFVSGRPKAADYV